MARAVAETSIVYDYEIEEVRLYTTRLGVANQIKKRLSDAQYKVSQQSDKGPWFFDIPMEYCRDASLLTRVIKSE